MGGLASRCGGIALLAGCGPVVGVGDGGAEGSADTTEVSSDSVDEASASEADDGRVDSTSTADDSSTGSDVCLSGCDCEPTGARLWRRTHVPQASERLLPQALARLGDGRLVIAGRHTVLVEEDSYARSVWVAIFDREAELLSSTTTFGGPEIAEATALGVATNGTQIVVAGFGRRSGEDDHGLLIVFDDELQSLWTVVQELDGIWNAATFDTDGGIVATGAASPSDGTVAVIDRFSATGELLWSRQAAGSDPSSRAFNRAESVAQRDGRVWVAGTLYNAHDDGEADVWTSRWELDGTLAIELAYDSGTELDVYASLGSDFGEDVAIAPSGDVLTVGSHYIRKDLDVGYILASERWARLVDRDGNEKWRWWHDAPASHPGIARAATFDDCGNAFVVGHQAPSSDADDQLFVAKLSPDGQTLWEVASDDISSDFRAYGIVADDDGSAVVMIAENDDTVVLSRWSP